MSRLQWGFRVTGDGTCVAGVWNQSGIRTVIPLQISGLSGHLLTDGFRKGDGLVGALVLELVGLVVFLQLGSSGGQSRRGDPHGHERSRVQASVKPVWTAWSVANGVMVKSRGVNAGRCLWSSLSTAEPDVGC
jgi:hypothetical protein